ncbi:MAG: flavin reductase family protein [Thalassobaculales bacterium]
MDAADPAAVDAAAFRAAMRQPASAVAIIAAGAPGGRTGMTATAVCSLSDSPPSLLACVNRGTYSFGVIRSARCFSVNFLCVDQVALAEVFAGRTPRVGEARFDAGLWHTGATGAPILGRSLATFDCRLEAEFEHATHTIFIGAVVAVHGGTDRAGLIYGQGAFQRAAPIEAAAD